MVQFFAKPYQATLDYNRDLTAAAQLFAKTHQIPVPEEKNHLIREDAPLSLIYEECAGLLQTYLNSELADPAIRDYLRELSLLDGVQFTIFW